MSDFETTLRNDVEYAGKQRPDGTTEAPWLVLVHHLVEVEKRVVKLEAKMRMLGR